MILDIVYLLGVVLIGPIYWLVRRARGKRLASPCRRLGFVPKFETQQPVVWFHAVSVGETLVVRRLVQELAKLRPDVRIVITSTTLTGLRVARESYPGLTVLECPYDLSGSVRRFLRRVKPKVLGLVELELWPNLLAQCRRAGVPVIVLNGKISERSARGYARLGRLLPGFMGSVTRYLVQTPVFQERLVRAGAPADRVEVLGNLKFDNIDFRDPLEVREALRREHGFSREAPILVAGSTHRGEEVVLLEVARRIGAAHPGFRLVLAPRHPERVKEVLELCRKRGCRVGLRTKPREPADPEVLLVDTMGELGTLYALGDLAFVGGTLIPVGGHNLLEPAGFGLAVLVGPYLETVREVAQALAEAGTLHRVDGESELESLVVRLISNPDDREKARGGARRVISAHRGSVARSLSVLIPLIERTPLA